MVIFRYLPQNLLAEALEADHVRDFSLLLSALCINDYPIDPRLVGGMLILQNGDGSFGPSTDAAGLLRFYFFLHSNKFNFRHQQVRLHFKISVYLSSAEVL